jgi:GNAT superfamily N-acetyltransferase
MPSELRLMLSIEDAPTPEDVDTVRRNLYDFNCRHAGEDNYRPLAVYLRDEAGAIAAGLSAVTFWGWLYVELLWVREDLRGQGIGGRLLETAEREAIQRGCDGVFLDTQSFQAPAFYKDRGYAIFGELPNMPEGHTRYYLAKRFDEGPAKRPDEVAEASGG